jgi:hypothetical protein
MSVLRDRLHLLALAIAIAHLYRSKIKARRPRCVEQGVKSQLCFGSTVIAYNKCSARFLASTLESLPLDFRVSRYYSFTEQYSSARNPIDGMTDQKAFVRKSEESIHYSEKSRTALLPTIRRPSWASLIHQTRLSA